MKHIYGPVASWRLKRSLGIDLISRSKKCTFDCNYCQLGRTKKHYTKRRVFVPTKEIISEFEKLPRLRVRVQSITFSGLGEPTLAKNLGGVISELKKRTKIKVTVLTNASLMNEKHVRDDLALADMVIAKLDAHNEKTFDLINKPARGITFRKTLAGIKKFNKEHPGKLALQVMFVPQNKEHARDISLLAKKIRPIEVQINTPLRPCSPRSRRDIAKPISPDELHKIKKMFKPLKTYCVYDVKRPKVRPISRKDTSLRRPEL